MSIIKKNENLILHKPVKLEILVFLKSFEVMNAYLHKSFLLNEIFIKDLCFLAKEMLLNLVFNIVNLYDDTMLKVLFGVINACTELRSVCLNNQLSFMKTKEDITQIPISENDVLEYDILKPKYQLRPFSYKRHVDFDYYDGSSLLGSFSDYIKDLFYSDYDTTLFVGFDQLTLVNRYNTSRNTFTQWNCGIELPFENQLTFRTYTTFPELVNAFYRLKYYKFSNDECEKYIKTSVQFNGNENIYCNLIFEYLDF